MRKCGAFEEKGISVEDGAFGENLLVEGFDFKTLPIRTRFHCGEVLLEMTQIGKECHSHCGVSGGGGLRRAQKVCKSAPWRHDYEIGDEMEIVPSSDSDSK